MANSYFKFKQFVVRQEKAAFKVGTDGVLLGAAADLTGASKILDVGTGTGLIALMCAQRCDAQIFAIEPDRDSFLQATENINASPWAVRVAVYNSDFESFSTEPGGGFDLVISNPPYFRDSLVNPEGRKAAARHAFSLSASGILECTLRVLKPGGSLQIILPYEEGTLFITEAAGSGLYCNSIIKVKPFPGGEVIRLIMKFEKKSRPVHERYLTIETGTRHNYTEEYKSVTRDFYLKFKE